MLNVQDQICDKRELQLWVCVQSQVWERVLDHVRSMFFDHVSDKVSGHVWIQVWDVVHERKS